MLHCFYSELNSCYNTIINLQVAGEQKYHPECFTCLNCRSFIGDGDNYALVERSKLYW